MSGGSVPQTRAVTHVLAEELEVPRVSPERRPSAFAAPPPSVPGLLGSQLSRRARPLRAGHQQHAAELLLAEFDELGQSHGPCTSTRVHWRHGFSILAPSETSITAAKPVRYLVEAGPLPGHFQPVLTILRRKKAICVASGRFFGHTSWQASNDMQPKTPSSSPMSS